MSPQNVVRAPSKLPQQKLVIDGYAAIMTAFTAAKQRGAIPKGRILSEMIYSSDWSVPPLMDDEKYLQYKLLTGYSTDDMLIPLICYTLETECGEKQLLPAITQNPQTGHNIVRLIARS